MSIENENRSCPSSMKDSRSSDCEVCGCLCVYVCSRGRSNNLLLSKKQQMDLTPLVLEVLGPGAADLTQLSFQLRFSKTLWPQPELPLDVALEKQWGSVAEDLGPTTGQGLCASSWEGSRRSYHTALRSHTTEKQGTRAPTSLSNWGTS